MELMVLWLLVAVYLAASCYSEPFIMELPGYAKAVVGGYGKFPLN